MALPKVSPEPLLIAVALILVAALIPLTTDSEVARRCHYTLPIWMGVVMGFGVATKFTFLPLLAFVFLFHGWVRKVAALAACAIAFVVFTAPIAVNYKWMVLWLETLATHKGVNGSGESGLPDLSTLFSNLMFLTSAAAPLFILLGLYFLMVLVLSIWHLGIPASEVGQVRRLLLISCVVLSVQIVATLKNLGAHYLIPSMVTSGLTNATITLLVIRAVPRGWPSVLSRLAAIAALFAGVFSAGVAVYGQAAAASAYAEGTNQLEQRIRANDATVVGYYRSSLLVYALAFGNDFAKDRYDARLRALYPSAVFYSIWLAQFYSFAGQVSDDEMTRRLNAGETVVLYGSPLVGDYAAYSKGLLIEPLFAGPAETAYRLVRIERGPPQGAP
jgi:hypothetical protein